MLLDVTRLLDRALQGRRPTGVDRVGLEYVRHFGREARALVRFGGRWLVPGREASRQLFEALLEPDATLPRRVRWLVGKSYVLNWRPPKAANILLNITHSGLQQADYPLRVRRWGLRALYFLHDLIPISHPEYARPDEAARHHRRVQTLLTTGCGLIVNSLDTGRAMERYATEHGLSVPPWIVAPLAPTRLPAPSDQRPLREPYFVVIGTIEPRKNHLLVLHLWRQLVQALGAHAPRLVIIGQRGWECEQVVDLLERCEALRGFVLERPGCDDAELATWLAHAQALLFPSFAEGFGMPLVEALAAGLPVLASDLPAFREVAGDVPDYLDPLDGPAWRQAVLDYTAPHSPRRAAQCARMQGFTAPTWEAHFARVEGFMRELGLAP